VIQYTIGTLTVGKKALTVTAGDRTKTYGDMLQVGSSEFTASGLVNNDAVTSVTLSTSGANATAGVGSYPVTASNAVGTGLANYSVTYQPGSLTIAKRGLTITASDRGKVYGSLVTFAGTEFNAAGLVNSDTVDAVTLASTGAATGASAGSYPVVASGALGSGLSNYTISYADGSLTVAKKALIVTANAASKTYGSTTTFAGTEFSAAGLVNGDQVTAVSLQSSGAASGSAVGAYTVVPSDASGSGLSNYNVSYASGALTVTPKALTVTPNARTKTYGESVAFAGTEFTADGLVGSDTVSSVTLASSGAGGGASAGSYTITAVAASGSGLSNYAISYGSGTLTVAKKDLTVTAGNRLKVYGDTLSSQGTEFAVAGLVNAVRQRFHGERGDLCDRRFQRGGHGVDELQRQLQRWCPDRQQACSVDHSGQCLEGLWRAGDFQCVRRHRGGPGELRHRDQRVAVEHGQADHGGRGIASDHRQRRGGHGAVELRHHLRAGDADRAEEGSVDYGERRIQDLRQLADAGGHRVHGGYGRFDRQRQRDVRDADQWWNGGDSSGRHLHDRAGGCGWIGPR
jgi:hypothetical protein